MDAIRSLAIAAFTIVCAAHALSGPAALGQGPEHGWLSGRVVSRSGGPLEGVIVSAAIPGEPITTSVYTGANGHYYFPQMKIGRYSVSAQAVGFERCEDAGQAPAHDPDAAHARPTQSAAQNSVSLGPRMSSMARMSQRDKRQEYTIR